MTAGRFIPEYVRPVALIVCTPRAEALEAVTPSNHAAYLFRSPPHDIPAYLAEHNTLKRELLNEGFAVQDVSSAALPPTVSAQLDVMPNMVFTRDSILLLEGGAVVLSMAAELRKEEPRAMEEFLKSIGIPILFRMPPESFLEGGDVVCARENLVFVGYGPRSTRVGIEHFIAQIRYICRPLPEIACVQVPSNRINLDGVFMVLDDRTVILDESLVDGSVILYREDQWIWRRLQDYLHEVGIRWVCVPPTESQMLATNIVHLGRRRVIAYAHNRSTNLRMRELGFEVRELKGESLVIGSGGFRCMTNAIRGEVGNITSCG